MRPLEIPLSPVRALQKCVYLWHILKLWRDRPSDSVPTQNPDSVIIQQVTSRVGWKNKVTIEPDQVWALIHQRIPRLQRLIEFSEVHGLMCLSGLWACHLSYCSHLLPFQLLADGSTMCADVLAQGDTGITPLHDAVQNGHLATVKLLLTHRGTLQLCTCTCTYTSHSFLFSFSLEGFVLFFESWNFRRSSQKSRDPSVYILPSKKKINQQNAQINQ